ncbi:MAG: ATP-dependent Clp protease adapter ClpS [Alphaproteobacteria bacterium]|nr:ATP-dependent Clp protease adapter ClpS [Alphaproteobacteria bacterium]
MKRIARIVSVAETASETAPPPVKDRMPSFVIVAVGKTEPAEPPLYKIILLNDDFTPMSFVVDILRRLFHKSSDEATEIMLRVHYSGSAECGTFTREVAETKAQQVEESARQNSHPLRCRIERDGERDGVRG